MHPPHRDSGLPPRTRRILHLDVDAFLASVEQALHPELQGLPVVVGGMPDSRNLVMSCSYAARAYGVKPGMRSAEAARRCPKAIFRHGDSQAATRLREQIVRILLQYSPLVEVTSIDDFLVDLTGTTRLAGAAFQVAEEIKLRVWKEVALPLTVGVATNRTLARLAGKLAKPGGIAEIFPGYERDFLNHMPVEHLPGVGHKIRRKLESFAIRTVGELALVSREVLFASFGPSGLLLYGRSRGIDEDPIIATHRLESSIMPDPRPSADPAPGLQSSAQHRSDRVQEEWHGTAPPGAHSAERPDPRPATLLSIRMPRTIRRDSTFEPEEGRLVIIEAMLAYVLDRATAHMRQAGLSCASMEVRLAYVDSRPAHIKRRDPGGGGHWLSVRRPLPGRVNERATDGTDALWQHALKLLRSLPRKRALVKRVGITLLSLRHKEGHQGLLFSDPGSDRAPEIATEGARGSRADRNHKLDDALDLLRARHGFGRILRGTSLPLKKEFPLGPDGYQLRTPSLNQ
ncbi:MAG: nucleotidyltransferase/DNA polymerase involved in DNA repair [Planctomycetota bacterium]|jgi:nucleotidyltransferase/DNA polymerase involved in DNA repair